MTRVTSEHDDERRGGWWVGVAAAAATAIALALAGGLMLAPDGPASVAPTPPASGLSSLAMTAFESLGLDGARMLGMRDELEAAFQRRRDELPSDAATSVDASIALLDRNIAELSTALEQDPGNPELARLLASAYRRQVEMLRTVDRVGRQVRPQGPPDDAIEPGLSRPRSTPDPTAS